MSKAGTGKTGTSKAGAGAGAAGKTSAGKTDASAAGKAGAGAAGKTSADAAGKRQKKGTSQKEAKRYEEALAILKDALRFGIEPSLVGIRALTRRLGDPQSRYPSIQIAGTNGKSSTARFTAAFLAASGKKVGLYTSPELVEYPERMEIDGAPISHGRFADAILAAHEAAQDAVSAGEVASITEFELLTAAALWLFAEEGVDFAVLEAGLGGRWDATSIVDPVVAVVTGVAYDHMEVLGNSIEQIAAEKAAIIKEGSIPVLGPGTEVAREVFLARCEEVGVTEKIVFAKAVEGEATQTDGPSDPDEAFLRTLQWFPLYQRQNIACAWEAASAALGHGLDRGLVHDVLKTLSIPGRFEVVREEPLLLIDAAHNPQSARALVAALIKRYGIDPEVQRIATVGTLLLGILDDKDAAGIAEILVPMFSNVAVTASSSPRAIPSAELASLVFRAGARTLAIYSTVPEAVEALAAQEASVVATGSITLVGEIKALLTQEASAQVTDTQEAGASLAEDGEDQPHFE
jgi:dihydrofolate synthase/folylpolyglutamate synthase